VSGLALCLSYDDDKRQDLIQDEYTTKELDFSKTPPLQDEYMNNGLHDINKAIKKLGELVKGFWVEKIIRVTS